MEGSRQSDGTPLKKLGLGVARGGEFQRLSDREGRGEEGGEGGGGRAGRREGREEGGEGGEGGGGRREGLRSVMYKRIG